MDIAARTVGTIPAYQGDIITETGPGFFRHLLDMTTYKMLPTDAFYPYLFNKPFSSILRKDLSKTYGVHVWGNSWFPTEMKSKKLTSMLHNGDLPDIRAFSSTLNCDDTAGRILDTYVDKIRAARLSIAEFARSELACGALHTEESAYFDLFKTCAYLLGKRPDAMVWQIGAGDGIANDRLRPVLVNFDPPAVLIEPNPYAYQRLVRNYAGNTNAKFLNAAFGIDIGKKHFFAVNLSKAEEIGVPTGFLHFSSLYADGRSVMGRLCCEPMAKAVMMECLECTSIDVINFTQLCHFSDRPGPDIMVIAIDTGVSNIIHDMLGKNARPDIIYFCTVGIMNPDVEKIEAMLAENYKLFDFEDHSIAYRKSFYHEYCETLFIEHGIETIFQSAMNVISTRKPLLDPPPDADTVNEQGKEST